MMIIEKKKKKTKENATNERRNGRSFDFFFIPLVINSMNVAAINIRLAIFYSESKALKFILKP